MLPPPVAVLPHRAPFLLLDDVTAMTATRLDGWWTPPDDPRLTVAVAGVATVPPTLVVEAIAQLGAYGAMMSLGPDHLPLFTHLDDARFGPAVRPGRRVDLTVELGRLGRRGGRGHGRARVGDEVVAEADIGFLTVPADRMEPP